MLVTGGTCPRHVHDTFHRYNAGFYFARPTRAADAFMEFWCDDGQTSGGRLAL